MVILGSTGSIGTQALSVAKRLNIQIEALSCGRNYKLLNQQIKAFKPKFVCVADEDIANLIDHDRVFIGEDGIKSMLECSSSDDVLNAIVGIYGLGASIYTQKLNKNLSLANKESLVIGGKFLDTSKIIPIDSEHFGLKFLLQNTTAKAKKLIITASGGAVRDIELSKIPSLSKKEILNHPNWSMGQKITTDSATMMNKIFEVLEAFWLYKIDNIDALIERSSKIHALIEFSDGSTTAHFAKADMILPITYGMSKKFLDDTLSNVNLLDLSFKFEGIDTKRYPIFSLKDEVLKNPNLGAIINLTNDLLVELFLEDRIKFGDISKILFKVLDKFSFCIENYDEIKDYNKILKEFILKEIKC